MKIAIIGYGKMGKEIETAAIERNHEIVLKINQDNAHQLTDGSLKAADVAIEFSMPETAVKNIKHCFDQSIPIVVGTTGWYDKWEEVKTYCEEKKGSLLAATNFSVGVNIFFELNRKLANLMGDRKEYQTKIEEVHHTEKLDSPSGTAISLAEDVLSLSERYNKWENEVSNKENTLPIISFREEGVPGTHTVSYESDIDSISISHIANNRKGFAIGAVIAAEFIRDKSGIFQMRDVLKI